MGIGRVGRFDLTRLKWDLSNELCVLFPMYGCKLFLKGC